VASGRGRPGGCARSLPRDRREPRGAWAAEGGGALARRPGSTASRHTAGTGIPAPPPPGRRRAPAVSPGAARARNAGFPTPGSRSSCCPSMTAPRPKDIRRPADPVPPVCGASASGVVRGRAAHLAGARSRRAIDRPPRVRGQPEGRRTAQVVGGRAAPPGASACCHQILQKITRARRAWVPVGAGRPRR
jgi:hypothetical protein